MGTDWTGYVYAVLVATGGIIGYIKAGSIMSLNAGVLFGTLAGVCAYQSSQNLRNLWLSLGTYGTMTVVMGVRFLSSWKVVPAGLMAGASTLMLLRITLGFWRQYKNMS